MGASLSKGLSYHSTNSFWIRQDIIIPEAQDPEADSLHVPISAPVQVAVLMLAAVYFNDDARFKTNEVGNVRAQWMLTTETVAV